MRTELNRIIVAFFYILLITFSLISLLPIEVSAYRGTDYAEVELEYLARNMEDYIGMEVETRGIVRRNFGSCYMCEDFWLAVNDDEIGVIPVMVKDTGFLFGLPWLLWTPPENTPIQVIGTVEYSRIEGGFYYLKLQEWWVISKFLYFLILSLFMIVTLETVVVYKKNKTHAL